MRRYIFMMAFLMVLPTSAKTILRLGTLAPDGSAWHKVLKQLAFDIKKETGGQVIVRLYAGGMVGSEAEMIRKMRIGQLQGAIISNAGLGGIDPAVYAVSVPMMFDSFEEWDHVRNQINPDLSEKLRARKFEVLTWSYVGWMYLFSKTQLALPDQLEKLKLASMVDEPATNDIARWAGLNPVPITVVDMLVSMQTGLVEACYMPTILAEGSQLYRYAGFMLRVPWAPLQGAIVLSDAAWSKVKPEHRDTLKRLSIEAGKTLVGVTRESEIKSLEAMKARGLSVTEPKADDTASWREHFEQIWPRLRGELVPSDTFDQVLRFRDEYRASKGTL